MFQMDSPEGSPTSKPETFLEHIYRAFNCGPAPTPEEFEAMGNRLLAEIGAAPLEEPYEPAEPKAPME